MTPFLTLAGTASRQPSSQVDATKEWWRRGRRRYNIGLIVSGLLAFICYVAVGFWGSSVGAIPADADVGDINLFTILSQGIGYLIVIGIANLLYYLGPLSERLIRPIDVDRYRRITFGAGFWFSVTLPFTFPALLACLCLIRPSWWLNSLG